MDHLMRSAVRNNCSRTQTTTESSISDADTPISNSNMGNLGQGTWLKTRQSHQAILESHANSTTNALIYITVVLVLYLLAMAFITIRYILMKSQCKSEHSSPPYYFGGRRNKTTGGTTTATTTFGTSGNATIVGIDHGASTCNEGEDDGDGTPPEIKFIETEL